MISDPSPSTSTMKGQSTLEEKNNSMPTSDPSPPGGTPSAISENFVAKQYEALRKEILGTTKQIVGLEYYALLITGATWAWLFEKAAPEVKLLLPLVALVPLSLVSLLCLKRWRLAKHIDKIGAFIKAMEKRFLTNPDASGWEHQEPDLLLKKWAKLFWILVIAVNVLAGLVLLGFYLRPSLLVKMLSAG
jgi:hypothetical protein